MDKVSVIVPVYNVAPYLARCVDALMGQTYENLEILLVDDGSSDGSAGIIDAYAQREPRVRALHQPCNQGVSAARNRGLDACTGDWVCFCDGDDWYLPEFVEKLRACAEREDADYVACGYQIVSDGKPPIPSDSAAVLASGCDARLVIACGPISSCTHLFRRELFSRTGVRYPVGCRQYEELPVIPVLAQAARRIAVVHEPLYCYYQRGDGTSASNAALDSEGNFLNALDKLRAALGAGYERELEYRAVYALFYGEILNLCKQGADAARIREKIDTYRAAYPGYLRNPYLSRLGRAKRLFLRLEEHRCVPGLRLLARIHAAIVG